MTLIRSRIEQAEPYANQCTLRELYANLGWHGMNREGEGDPKTSPLINTDDIDQKRDSRD